MQPGTSSRHRAGIGRLAALALACAALALACAALTPASAWAAESRPGDGDLSPRLAELARPAVRAAPRAEQARELSLPAEGPGSLLRDGNRVLVEVRFDRGAAASVDGLRAAGAQIVNVSPRYQTVTVAAKPGELRGLSALSRIESATEVPAPISHESACPAGVAISEGDGQLEAAQARDEFEVDGSGIKVGVLSDSFATATEAVGGGPIATIEATDVASGDLPGAGNECLGQETPVDNLDDYEPSSASDPEPADEGRAMAQIVHDLAPGADIAFATAFTGLPAFAENVKALASAGADVIVDDVSYFEEPFFQEGPVGAAVSKVTDEESVSYFSSAGNNNPIDDQNIASWEAPKFRDANCPAGVPPYATDCMDFDPSGSVDATFELTVPPGETLTLICSGHSPGMESRRTSTYIY